MPIPLLGPDPASPFPPPARALRSPDGLLAAGGDLSPVRLLNAYRNGIFPWFSEGEPILWWSPDPRMVFDTASFRLSSRLRRSLRHSDWSLRADTAFDEVMATCASAPRPGQDGTWIGSRMRAAYGELHRLGHAHSIEVRAGDRLVGGIYGVAIGRMFYGESMFSGESGGSKVALAALARVLAGWGWPLIDAQVENPHLLALGARRMPRAAFLAQAGQLAALPGRVGAWTEAFGAPAVAGLADQA
jgi:leucyl/phenylalanyl-tRNA--protein transferase